MRFFGLDPRRIGGAFFGGLLLGTPLASAAENEPAPAADAFARMMVKGSKVADPNRVEAVQKYLDGAFK